VPDWTEGVPPIRRPSQCSWPDAIAPSPSLSSSSAATSPVSDARDFTKNFLTNKKGKSSPYSITERRVPEPIPVLGSQPAGDVSALIQ